MWKGLLQVAQRYRMDMPPLGSFVAIFTMAWFPPQGADERQETQTRSPILTLAPFDIASPCKKKYPPAGALYPPNTQPKQLEL